MEININCDLGEKSKFHSTENDPDLLNIVNSASVACGFHAGDPNWMKHTVETASKSNVEIGAHASYFDLRGFVIKKFKDLDVLEIDNVAIDSFASENEYFSHRRAKKLGQDDYGRCISVIRKISSQN